MIPHVIVTTLKSLLFSVCFSYDLCSFFSEFTRFTFVCRQNWFWHFEDSDDVITFESQTNHTRIALHLIWSGDQSQKIQIKSHSSLAPACNRTFATIKLSFDSIQSDLIRADLIE
jgi:hypothetical protein